MDDVDVKLNQREIRLGGRRLVMRSTGEVYQNSDLVVVEQARRNIDVYIQLLRSGKKIAMWGHGRDYVDSPSRVRKELLTRLTNKSAWFFGYTHESVDAVVSSGFDRGRTTNLRNTIDTRTLRRYLESTDDREVEEIRRQLKATHLAVTIGAVDESKRIPFLLDACALVASRLDGFKLVIAGDGADSSFVVDQSARHEWLIKQPPVRGKDLALLLKAADVLAMPGRVGLVAVDALTARVPTVTTDWPYHAPERAYLDASTSVVSRNTVRDFANELEMLLRNPAQIESMSRACIASSEGLSIQEMAERFIGGILGALERQE
ncbi:glycosyltransferase family 4 protein [Gordonia sp. YY1]|uniref:glycosyltransferase family 4 protein n=1 Tax=Gordonia sp. YY1 TaxID=396712 RepID=UPI001331BF0C|nr:glycosyltransferase family 4 protein [Gordonia sp. YY1]